MNKDNYINAMDHLNISDDFKERSERLMKNVIYDNTPKKTGLRTKQFIFSMASLAVIFAVGSFAWNTITNNRVSPPIDTILGATESDEDTSSEDTSMETAEYNGFTIPEIALPESTDTSKESTVSFDMIGLFVYQGRIYVMSNTSFERDARNLIEKEDVLKLRGDYIGKTTGSITEWSKQEDYSKEFASTLGEADVYKIKGYDSKYRLMVCWEYEDGFDAEIYDSLGGLTLYSGEDLFSILKLKDNVTALWSEEYDSWDNGLNKRETVQIDSTFDNFMENLYRATPIGDDTDLLIETSDIYNQKFIHLKTNDGLITSMRLIKGGYAYLPYAGFFQLNKDVFDAFWKTLSSAEASSSEKPAPVEISLTPDSYPVGTENLTLTFKNRTNKEVWYGLEYQMEQKINGEWVIVPAVADLAFIEIAKVLPPKSDDTFIIDLSQLKPSLEAGSYRIIKTLEGQEFQIPFTLTD